VSALAPEPQLNRGAITVCVILATLMQALDTTIANVALPYMQGSVSASQDQIDWVLTSYIVAAAIMTPPTGYLATRFGIKRLFLVSIAGFTVASMLCGMAQSLVEIVLFRVLQGMFGAALVPLSQSMLLNINPPERQGSAMALWGVAVMAGPVLGPVLGGWLTEAFSWRYVFFINLPIGVLAFIGMNTFLPKMERAPAGRFDWFGFTTLSLAIGAFQVLLDRGEELDWFGSSEIIIEAIIGSAALYLFVVHTFTAKAPFVRPGLFKDRNFSAGVLFVAVVGLTYYASLALQPDYLQDLMNYPIVTAGLVMGPRGLGTMGAMLVVGRLIGKVDTRLLLGIGLGLTAWSFWSMTGWTPVISAGTIVGVGVVQGMGLGFLFTPLSVVTLSTLSPLERPEGAGLYSLARNIGSSVGISVVNSLLTQNTHVNHAAISSAVTAVNRSFAQGEAARIWSPFNAAGRAALDAVITRQAQIIAYIDDYKLLMIATIAIIPLLLVFKKAARVAASDRPATAAAAAPPIKAEPGLGPGRPRRHSGMRRRGPEFYAAACARRRRLHPSGAGRPVHRRSRARGAPADP
jgi:DHA2 family multidrug resistance protein